MTLTVDIKKKLHDYTLELKLEHKGGRLPGYPRPLRLRKKHGVKIHCRSCYARLRADPPRGQNLLFVRGTDQPQAAAS